MQLNYQKIKKILPVILILVFILIFYFLSWPAYQQIQNTKKLIKIKQDALDTLQMLKELPALDKIDKILPDNPKIPELLVQLESLAQTHGMILKSIDFNKDELTAKMQIAGTYQNFKKYLKAVENNLRLLDITNLSFENNDFNLTIKSYYGSEKKTKNIID